MKPKNRKISVCLLVGLVLFLFTTDNVCLSETYKGINPLDTLSDLKSKFPNAQFEKLQPAWAQATDVMYSITGAGLSGTIIVKLTDLRPYWKEQLANATDPAQIEGLKALLESSESSEDQISIDWVRWIPDFPIPLKRFIMKYGKPEKSDFLEENMQPFKEWESRGIQAFLTDDTKSVNRIDYTFTDNEVRDAWKLKLGFIPKFLNVKKEQPKKNIRKIQKNK